MEKYKYIMAYMECAEAFAKTSEAQRLKVGCVFVRNRRILTQGVNGTPPGWDTNVCEDENNVTKDCVLHAEENAVNKARQDGESLKESTVYLTHAPCQECAILLHEVGVERVIYKEEYRSTDGVEFLVEKGIRCLQI